MKKFTCLGLSMVLALGLLAGCGGNDASTSEPAGSTPDASAPAGSSATELSGSVATDGSTSMESVIGVLGEQFMADHPDVSVTYNPTGSGAGIEAVSNGSCDIGLASRALKDEEKEGGLTETVVALDGIAVIVNGENSVTDLSLEQIASRIQRDPGKIFPSPGVWIRFHIMRIFQRRKKEADIDQRYWAEQGWLGRKRPWKET